MSTYQGHHGQHQALQNHSVGEIYPWAIVAYDNGGEVRYTLEDLAKGLCACQDGCLISWVSSSTAMRYAMWHGRGWRHPSDESIAFTRAPRWLPGRPVFDKENRLVLPTQPRVHVSRPALPLTPYQEYQRVCEIDDA